MNKIMFVALAALLFFSCSNESEDTPQVGNASLYLSISMPKTRAMIEKPTESVPNAITKLMIKAYDAADKVVGSSEISGQKLTNLLAANGAAAGENADQIVIETVSSNATYIRVWGYHDATQNATPIYAGTEKINDLQALGFNGVPYEAGKITITKGATTGTGAHADHKVWTATATIQPYLARFEVSGIPGLKAGGDLENASIQVTGIYMNNIKLDAQDATTPTLKVGNGAHWDFASAKKNNGGNWENGYYTDYASMFDGKPDAATAIPTPAIDITGTGATSLTDLDIWKDANKAVGYNIYSQSETPHVIICVVIDMDKSATTANDRFYGFVTVAKFKKGTTTDATIPTDASGYLNGIIRGNLYQIDLAGLELTSENITPDPESKNQDLYLKLTVTPWNKVTLTPEL